MGLVQLLYHCANINRPTESAYCVEYGQQRSSSLENPSLPPTPSTNPRRHPYSRDLVPKGRCPLEAKRGIGRSTAKQNLEP